MHRGPNLAQGVSHAHFSVGDTGIKLICACVVALGIAAYIAYLQDNQDIGRSAAWPTVKGTLTDVGSGSAFLPIIGSYIPICTPFAKYTYSVNGRTYSGVKNGGPSLSLLRTFTWRRPEIEIEKMDFEKEFQRDEQEAIAAGRQGDRVFRQEQFRKRLLNIGAGHYKPVTIRYEKSNPENSVLDPEVLQSDKSQLYTAILLIGVGGLLLGFLFLHGFVTAPTPDDPSLSLEAALAAQQKRRR